MNSATLARLKEAVGATGFSEDPAEIRPHLEEWRSKYTGSASLLLKPQSTGELSRVLAICSETKTAVVPQGGNTGLVGGQIAFENEVVIVFSRMKRVRAIDPDSRTVTAEAGAVLGDVHREVDAKGLLFPLSLASEGSCTIGGNISTNAGGVSVLRYGMMRDLVLGLEVVLADGRVLDLLRTLRKDNTGYDLKQLFIGAEGTLGLVTAAALKLFPKPAVSTTAFVALPSPAAAIKLLSRLQERSGGLITAFELIPRIGLELVIKHLPGTRDPLASPSAWYALVEASAAEQSNLTVIFNDAISSAIAEGIATDAALATSERQRTQFWALRENLSEAQKREGASIKHDISVPIARIPDFLEQATAAVLRILPGARPVSFGHLGDGNIHFNFSVPEGGAAAPFLAKWDSVQRAVHDIVMAMGGSFSAEHGIGVMKRADLAHYRSAAEIDLMRTLKRALDPHNILNPGKLVPD